MSRRGDMKPDPCPHGEPVAQAVRTGMWSDQLKTHVAACVSCRESGRVVRWMSELAQSVDSGSASLPDPYLIWLKARIRRRSQDSWRAQLPIRIACMLSLIGLALMLALLPDEGLMLALLLEARGPVQAWLTSGGTLLPELPNLLSTSLVTSLWIPAGILVILLLLISPDEA